MPAHRKQDSVVRICISCVWVYISWRPKHVSSVYVYVGAYVFENHRSEDGPIDYEEEKRIQDRKQRLLAAKAGLKHTGLARKRNGVYYAILHIPRTHTVGSPGRSQTPWLTAVAQRCVYTTRYRRCIHTQANK